MYFILYQSDPGVAGLYSLTAYFGWTLKQQSLKLIRAQLMNDKWYLQYDYQIYHVLYGDLVSHVTSNNITFQVWKRSHLDLICLKVVTDITV